MKIFTLLFVIPILLTNANCFAQAGTLDSTFSSDGIVEGRFNGESKAYSVAIQPDGKIIVAGDRRVYLDIGLARYQPDGTLDSSFGMEGQTVSDFELHDHANSVALQADGKIVVAGTPLAGSVANFNLFRYRQDGKLDNAFGENGKVTTDFGPGSYCWASSVAIQPNGKIIVTGYNYNGSNNEFAIARYKQDGRLDKTFGTKGKVTSDLGGEAYSAAIQSDGKIIVVGRTVMARYKSNGDPDSAFGTNGKVFIDFEDGVFIQSVALQADGKIVVAGNTPQDVVLARYRPNGNLDSVFGINGKVITDLGSYYYDYGRSVAIQADGKIVVAGALNHNFALIRYKHDGKPDNSFGTAGKVITDLGNHFSESKSVVIQPDGKIVVAGFSGGDYVILRYNGDNTSVSQTSTNNFSSLQKQNNTTPANLLSPNPVKDILHIQGLSSSTKTISVIDVKGKLLQQTATSNISYSFSTKQLSAGIYFIRIDEGDKNTTLKFVKE